MNIHFIKKTPLKFETGDIQNKKIFTDDWHSHEFVKNNFDKINLLDVRKELLNNINIESEENIEIE